MTRATVFEDHASVLPHWRARGLRAATVVCLDAHLDLQRIDAERIAQLRDCEGSLEFAVLQASHPLSPHREACWGDEDFLYAAAGLGLVRRVVWVAPPYVVRSLDAVLGALSRKEGVTPEQLQSFRVDPGGWIAGTLLGVELLVARWEQLPLLPLHGELAIDVDTRFFVQLPHDRVWAEPAEVLSVLRDSVGAGRELTIARSVACGSVPLRQRFLSDQLAALWEGRLADADYYDRLLAIDQDVADAPERLARARALLAERPDCAAACHALAIQCGDAAERAVLLARAAALDDHYVGDVLRHLGALRLRREELDLASVLRIHRQLLDYEDSAERLDTCWVALGLLYAGFGRLRDAVACDHASRVHGGGHPELALQIGRLHMEAGLEDQAQPWLERAASAGETRVSAWLHLSVCAARRGTPEEAWNWARAASEAAPAWPEPAHWLRRLAAKPGYDWASSARSSTG
jgi:hypothetical protein